MKNKLKTLLDTGVRALCAQIRSARDTAESAGSAAASLAEATSSAIREIEAALDGKQDKLTGKPGQAVMIGSGGVPVAQDAAGSAAVYTKTFAAGDWTGTNTKTISIPASEHKLAGQPVVRVYMKSGNNYITGTWGAMAVLVTVDASRNITLSYNNTAFAGRAVVTG